MRRGFKFLQAFDAQILVELPRGYLADAGHRSKQCKGIVFAPEPLQHGQFSVQKDIPDRARNGFTHPRNLLQSGDSFFSKYFRNRA
jgi:hypothetical protein